MQLSQNFHWDEAEWIIIGNFLHPKKLISNFYHFVISSEN